jgi:hypothetical protein
MGFIGTDTFTYRVCDNGSPNDIVSRFDFDNPDLTIAQLGQTQHQSIRWQHS